jgi:hypothetical protein
LLENLTFRHRLLSFIVYLNFLEMIVNGLFKDLAHFCVPD